MEGAGTLRQLVSRSLLVRRGLLATKIGGNVDEVIYMQDVPNGAEEGLEGVEQMWFEVEL